MTGVTRNYPFAGGFPGVEAARRAREDGDFQRAVAAYRFWYPTVSAEGVFDGNRALGLADNEAFGIAACGPRHLGFTLNSDTPYGAAVLDLSDGPMVIDMPAGPYIGLVNDHHQRWLVDMGISGPDRGRGGSYLLTPPGYRDSTAPGHQVVTSDTVKVLVAVRAMPTGADLEPALNSLRDIKIHRLGEQSALAVVDITDRALDSTCLRWENNLEYWRVLHRIVNAEPLLPEFLPMYGLLTALGVGKNQPFDPDRRMVAILGHAARAGRDQLLVSAFAGARADRLAWSDRRWEWLVLVPGSADFLIPAGIDMEARERWFVQAIVTSPAMFRRREGSGSLYWLAARDDTGRYLDGGRAYSLTIPLPVPAEQFWSVTIYDSATRSQVRAEQDKAALRSLFELRDIGTDTVTLHFGPEPPPGGRDRWLQTVRGRGWFAYFRIYGPRQAAFDGRWKPGDLIAD